MDNKTADELSKSELDTDDREVLEKKSINVADVKSAVSDSSLGLGANAGKSVLRTGAILVFSLLLLISGVFLAIFTSYTIFGLIIGIAMIVAAIGIPFMTLGKD